MIYDLTYTKQLKQEMIATIYALSQPALKQMELIGPPFPGEEMFVDFIREYSDTLESYLHYNFFNEAQIVMLNKLEVKLRAIRARPDSKSALLDPSFLKTDNDWELVRVIAKNTIDALGLKENQITPNVEIEQHDNCSVFRYNIKIQTEKEDM